MMKTHVPVERLFNQFNEIAMILQEELSCTYLEALAETVEDIFHHKILQEELSDFTKKRVMKILEENSLDFFTKEQIRKAYQLAILKGMKEYVQPNHQMTPDSIGMFVSFLIEKFINEQNEWTIMDPACGSGNLLATILNQLQGKQLEAYGLDIDDLLIKLAFLGANLLEQTVQFYNQDSLEPMFVNPVDVTVCDLPVGYYPNDERAKDYEVSVEEGHTYAHHLFIEQSIKHTKQGGYLFFLIPNGLFESEQAPKLHELLKKYVHIQSVIQLPISMFKNKHNAKSILILQKKAPSIQAPKQVLLANLPSLKNKEAMEKIIIQIDAWIKENKK
ncbi:site-specific DNA-methyltransferase (adenine-specific) [Oikeobacillus pervagus]|uniref:Site-specific DNA-methyltransferase (Adenine-specific) n=2 Tax=Oikeobacillus pervagus TaxID=1325931 RepID=A0AAJ1T1M0_9BACI|nr:site-specific DNA-methyltransferase (adenine-specific) [Oikeobacillus pervagus]